MATIMLILSTAACILCCYRRCTRRIASPASRMSTSIVIKNGHMGHTVGQTRPVPPPMAMRSSRSSIQNGNNLLMHPSNAGGYAQMSKNGTEWLVVTHDMDEQESDEALTV